MDLYYGILDGRVVSLTYAICIDEATDQIELALAGEDIFDTDNLEITRFPRNGGTVVLALEN